MGWSETDIVSDEDRYLFDLNGYLHLDNLLSADELAELNGLMDRQNIPEPGAELADQLVGDFLLWGAPFRILLDHPRVMPYLSEFTGPEVRLDRYYAIHMRKGTSGLPLHGGSGNIHNETEYYRFQGGRPRNGITTVLWALRDQLPGQGGFVCVPGSHKSNYPRPEGLDHRAPCATHVPLRAGDAVLFTSSLAHGAWPWEAAHNRRSLVFKYAPRHMGWSQAYLSWPEDLQNSLTESQRALLTPPSGARERQHTAQPAFMNPAAPPGAAASG
ncbi:phytanoyl-CoA dioxygenase family protein [Streptomyces sp. NPDC060053]|uniref:phytanoyl-CoA dioxygenase family protein n=1 Tax=Streptomyces sp. NPDC060053 TaxID=3347047 RepID=UPI00367E5F24